ncbi:MAG: Asp-tRNA(Asn)/Glu-tRNA(Gln) amidotransferase subunit GatC [Gammaproteobacteria bacterium]|nr:Asp-tRNA(Asn)/Glu-tRNA(Gln) amidotransferase subunit GatC [Gammaproteobacteria bacterium]NIO61367.1 Asp-tRNA(Asn)/Glu-tRNA(Gln) amidotransferase subunit GatC [Gammaproteobacteria bacterium]
MSIDRTEIDNIAWLARLELDEESIPAYQEDLSNILKFVEQMQGTDTTNIEPLAHPLEISARLRPDKVTETNQQEKFQKIAPAVASGFYLVPKVIE